MWDYGEENDYVPPSDDEVSRIRRLDEQKYRAEKEVNRIAEELQECAAALARLAEEIEGWSVTHVMRQAVINLLYTEGYTVQRKE